MKHIFVVNPNAGSIDATQEISAKISTLKGDISSEIYVTKGAGDATIFVRQWCENHPGEAVRFYACGGDGTINEVVSGLIDYPQAQMSCHPCGSGNDYVKYYGTENDFLNLNDLINGEVHKVDVMRVEIVGNQGTQCRYSINVCNFGFDAAVAQTMQEVKRKPIIGGRNAYTTGILKGLITARRNFCQIKVDGTPFNDATLLLCTLSNGQYVGGGFRCAPLSKNDDGLIDICLFKPVTLLQFISIIGKYAKGEHLSDPKLQHHLQYSQGHVVEMESSTPFYVCIDGEMLCSTRYRVEQMPNAVTFVTPRTL